MCNYESIMVTKNIDPKNPCFWAQILCTLAKNYTMSDICHSIMHHARCDDFVVHISVLLLKQNIC